jgi:hypothetical protein
MIWGKLKDSTLSLVALDHFITQQRVIPVGTELDFYQIQ